MTRQCQVIVTLAPDGSLQAELPINGGRRRVPMRDGEVATTLHRMLQAQLAQHRAIGQDGSPTEAQVRHWERHAEFPDMRCAFCRAEAMADAMAAPAKPAKARPRIIAEHGGVTVRQGKRQPIGFKSRRSAEELGL